MTNIVWKGTGLWYPGETTVEQYGRVRDPQAGEIVDPLNDTKTASVTVSMYDPFVADLIGSAFRIALKGYWRDDLKFWGPIKFIEGDMKAGTLKLTAADPSIRLIHHQLRRGDLAGSAHELTISNQDQGAVTIDHLGMRLLRDAGLNTTEQTTRGVPDLGIINGTNTFVADDPTPLLGVQRGDPVWSRILEVAESLGPDLEVQAIEDTVGAYAQLNTFAQKGSDKSASVQFHFGRGRKNLDNLTFTEGSEYVTHAHVLDEEATLRVTEASVDASADTGPYVRWARTGFKKTPAVPVATAETVLRAQGQSILQAYGRPLLAVNLELPIDHDGAYHYGEDYETGDIVQVAGKKGYCVIPAEEYRITKVTLRQEEKSPLVRPHLEVVSNRAAADTLDPAEQ